jgi:hypothetical protein
LPVVVQNLPYSAKEEKLQMQGGVEARLLPRQIVIWVSLTRPEGRPNENTPRFPAIFDTGFNGNFLIQEQHLLEWAGISPGVLDLLGSGSGWTSDGKTISFKRLDAKVWIYKNLSGSRLQRDLESVAHFALQRLPEPEVGIGVALPGVIFPRLPLLGVLSLEISSIEATFKFPERTVSLQTP